MDVPWNCSFPKVSERCWELRDSCSGISCHHWHLSCMWAYAKGGSLGRRTETSICCEKRRADTWEGNMAGPGFPD